RKLGTTSLWVLYAALVFSCAFLPSLLIKKLRVKWTLVVSMFAYSAYMAAQFYPTYYTMIPTAIILGLGAAPMWSAKCTYLTLVGEQYADLVGENSEVIITRFFGIFFLFFQSSQVIGNFISSSVLSAGVENLNRSEAFLDKCGANYCPDFAHNLTAVEGVAANATQTAEDKYKITIMSAIYLGCSLVSALIIAVFVDSLAKYGEAERTKKQGEKSGMELLMATFKHLKNPYQILIIPLTVWSGVEQAFIGADFHCGIRLLQYMVIMICYAICDALCSFGFSPLVKLIGRVPIFIFWGSCQRWCH
ncbi:UNVERIFIED_CONTAM: hypothetical protein GTU68_056127, partial [Idotea baltica]|nr:hypothetical protein [Idotea baltica]